MPNRIIKETIHTSEKINSLTDFQFRLWVNLLVYVDDFGRGDARPAVIKGACFPLRDRITIKDIDAALTALTDAGCVSLYNVGGKPYLCLSNWESHQVIRNQKSKFPAPPEIEINCNQLKAIESNCNQLQANVSVIQSESEIEIKEGILTDTQEKAPCPYAQILRLYNEICVSLPKIIDITGKRRIAVESRWNAHPSLETFKTLFEIAENSDFLKGENNRKWKADFDWLMCASNFSKVLEGKYNDSKKPKKEVGFDLDEFFNLATRRND